MPVCGLTVTDVSPSIQFLDTFGVSVHRPDPGQNHQFGPANRECFRKAVQVPQLKNSEVQADVVGRQPSIA